MRVIDEAVRIRQFSLRRTVRRLAVRGLNGHIWSMTTIAAKSMTTIAAKKIRPPPRSEAAERTVIYRGIKIAPIVGQRSPLAKTIRDGLRTQSEQSRGKRPQA